MVLTSCSIVDRPDDNEGDYGKDVTVKGTIMARATGEPEDTNIGSELINDWWVLFVDNTEKIVKYIDRTTATGNTKAVVEEGFYLEIPAGTYTAYSFANITRTQVEKITGEGTLAEGNRMPANINNVDFNITSIIPNGRNFEENTTNIPMTGKQEVTFQKDGAAVVLEVIRMVAKLEFRYRNASTKDITINSVSMQQTNLTSIPLLPNYEYLKNGWPVDATDGATEAATYKRNIAQTLGASGTEIQFTDIFYMIEEQAKFVPAKRFTIALNITRKGQDPETLYAMTDNLESFYRNDHVVIPIVFSDYAIDIDVNFYPPIGGYPAVITNNDKDDFYCEFATQGNFVIRPKVEDASNGHKLIYNNGNPYFTYALKSVDNTDIFSIAPHIEAETGELLGCLN
ncbi:MAG: hypothetical protein Q4D33_05025, partial [Prevotellaceae bacterium]|nr:hypothetical protein [Prevotellaceae bacterium]